MLLCMTGTEIAINMHNLSIKFDGQTIHKGSVTDHISKHGRKR